MEIKNYLDDGANWQAQCVLAYLRNYHENILDPSWDEKKEMYMATLSVGRFEDCQEQGYMFSLRYGRKQINYAVYGERHTDEIRVMAFELYTIDTPTLKELYSFFESHKTRQADFRNGHIVECGDWIWSDIKNFFDKCKKDGSAFPVPERKCNENKVENGNKETENNGPQSGQSNNH